MQKVLSVRNRSDLKRKLWFGFAGISILKALYCIYQANQAQKEIAFRKSQLSKPIYELKETELTHFPWNKQNINEWLYRRVKVVGRPIHVDTCMVPRTSFALKGYEYVVPLVTEESLEEPDIRSGLIISKGFIPQKWKVPVNRPRIEETCAQTFVGFVSRLPELSDHGFFDGNSPAKYRLNFTHANLKDFAEASGFQNKKQASVAVVQVVEGGELDQRNGQTYAHNSEYHHKGDYPFPKTLSGALQLKTMPWQYRTQRNYWLGGFTLGTLFAVL